MSCTLGHAYIAITLRNFQPKLVIFKYMYRFFLTLPIPPALPTLSYPKCNLPWPSWYPLVIFLLISDGFPNFCIWDWYSLHAIIDVCFAHYCRWCIHRTPICHIMKVRTQAIITTLKLLDWRLFTTLFLQVIMKEVTILFPLWLSLHWHW
jgi:hypothetical protein